MEEKEYEITPILDKENKYVIQNYDKVIESATAFIKENEFTKCENGDELSLIKKSRTLIRSKKDAITRARININNSLLGTFNEQLKELETMLNNADINLKRLKDNYEEEQNNINKKPAKLTLIVKSYDLKTIEKIKTYALKLGAEIGEK